MPGHLLLYHPAVQKLKELIDARRARRGAVHLRQPPEPRHRPHERERALVARRPRPLGDPLPARRGARGRARARPRLPPPRASRTSSSATCASPRGKIAHMHLSWLDPHKMRRLTVVGRDKMAVFDDMELERKVTIYDKAPVEARRDLRRVADPLRRHLHPEDPDLRAAAARVRALPPPRRRRGRPGQGRARRRDGRARARAADRPLCVAD